MAHRFPASALPARPNGWFKRSLNANDGAMALEYGLLLPAFALLIFGAADISRMIWTYTTLHRATEAAARCAAINQTLCGTSSKISSYAVSQAWGLRVYPSNFTSQTTTCGIQVTAQYGFTMLIPWPGSSDEGQSPSEHSSNAVTLRAQACYPI